MNRVRNGEYAHFDKGGNMSQFDLFCSTGTMVGRKNGYNVHFVTELFPSLMEEGCICGAELMMIISYYDRMDVVADEWLRAGIVFPVIHAEKEIGTNLSDAGKAFSAGDTDTAKKLHAQAIEDFRRNCEMGAMVNSRRMVLHLWGGLTSDAYIGYNLSVMEELLQIIRPYGIRLLIENVPCTTENPLLHWRRLNACGDEHGLIFDTRFGFFHRQSDAIWGEKEIVSRIEHIHISDIRGEERDFSALRPIYHPGEGMVDFRSFVRHLRENSYRGTFTLESPVIQPDGADGAKLRDSLILTRKILDGITCDA
jgi:sugar phosphate isomerase/epimerase